MEVRVEGHYLQPEGAASASSFSPSSLPGLEDDWGSLFNAGAQQSMLLLPARTLMTLSGPIGRRADAWNIADCASARMQTHATP